MLAELAAAEQLAGKERKGVGRPRGDEDQQIAQRLGVAHKDERGKAEGDEQHRKRRFGQRDKLGLGIEQHRREQQIQPVDEIQRIKRARTDPRQQRRGDGEQRRGQREKQTRAHADAAEHLPDGDCAEQRDHGRIYPCAGEIQHGHEQRQRDDGGCDSVGHDNQIPYKWRSLTRGRSGACGRCNPTGRGIAPRARNQAKGSG